MKTAIVLIVIAFILTASVPVGINAANTGYLSQARGKQTPGYGGYGLGCPGCPGCPDNPNRAPGAPGCY